MIKGIPQKILAFEKFLEENPEWNDQIVVSIRTDVLECMNAFCVLPSFANT
jgi:trehalose 6-phosphate synthase/phosphatase